MKRKLLVILLISLLVGLGGGMGLAMPPAPGSPDPAVSTLADGIALEWHLAEPQTTHLADGSLQVGLPGFETSRQPGMPLIPINSYLVALPPDAQPEIKITKIEFNPLSPAGPIAQNPVEDLRGPEGQQIREEAALSKEITSAVMFTDLGDYKGVRLGQVTLNPIFWLNGSPVAVRRLGVEVIFHGHGAPAAAVSESFASSLNLKVVNPAHLSTSLPALQPLATTAPPAWQAAIEINAEGLYKITYENLFAAGLQPGLANPQNLHLLRGGVDAPFEWVGDGDAIFEAGEIIYFFGSPRTSRWSNKDVYFLVDTGLAALSMPTRPGTITTETAGTAWYTRHVEENQIYIPDCFCAGSSSVPLLRDGDRWAWVEMFGGSQDFTFIVSNPNTSLPGSLTVFLAGSSDITGNDLDHSVNVALNGTFLGSMQWNGRQAAEAIFTVPAGKVAGNNTLRLTMPGIPGVVVESMWVDAFQLSFQQGNSNWTSQALFKGRGGADKYYEARITPASIVRVYEITNPTAPVRLTGPTVAGNTIRIADQADLTSPRFLVMDESQALAPAALRAVQTLRTQSFTGITWVAIAPNAWISSLAPLANLRQAQGFVTAVESVEAIYDQYGQGLPIPDAIKAYLQQVYAGRPVSGSQYVLLVGDGTIDPKHYDYLLEPNPSSDTFIPPYLADYDPWATEGATDNRYVTMGGPSDLIPDMQIGRLAANSISEVQAMVNKLVQYDTTPVPGSWKNQAVVVAANPDNGGDYRQSANQEAGLLTCTTPVTRFLHMVNYTDAAVMRTALFNKWNSGTSLLIFHGHATIHAYDTRNADNSISDLFHFNDIPSLTNGGKLPVNLSMTCFTGAYQTRTNSVLDEALVRASNGGSIASWGSTGLGLIFGQENLAQGFISWVISNGDPRVGDAALAGKLQLLTRNVSNAYLADSFTLFGDPATVLKIQDTQKCIYVPKTVRGGTP